MNSIEQRLVLSPPSSGEATVPPEEVPLTPPHDVFSLTRRQLLAASILLGLTGCRFGRSATKALSDENLMGASALSGPPLKRERIRAMKVVFEFNLKHLEVLREFDADEEEPLTMFRL